MLQCIQTKFIGATAHKTTRIKAWCKAGQYTINYPHELSEEDAHRLAAECLVERLGWKYGELIGGHLNRGHFVFVFDFSTNRKMN